MSEYFTFAGATFVAVASPPTWVPQIESTDRRLIGTDRFERSIRSRQWSMEINLWIEPDSTAAASFAALQAAYANATAGDLVLPGDPAPAAVTAMLITFDVTAARGGIDGYQGKAVFSLPGGRP